MPSHPLFIAHMIRSIAVVFFISAVVSAETRRLHVLTQNVQLTPLVGGTEDEQIRRAGKLVNAVLHANPPYDIVGFQEVFMDNPMQVLIDGLSPQFPAILTAIPDGKTLFGSGLFFASRFPIKRWNFHKYTKASGFDAVEPKGLLVAELNVSSNGSSGNLVVALTHQQSGGSDDVMTSQVQEGGDTVAAFLRQSDRNMKDFTTVIYMGDMNIDEVSQHNLYVQMRSSIGESVTDLFRDQHPNDPGLTWPVPTPQQRLDYIFNIKSAEHNPCQFGAASTSFNASVDYLVRNGTLSDHFGSTVFFDMQLKQNAEIAVPVVCVTDSSASSTSAAASNVSMLNLVTLFLMAVLPMTMFISND